jgi:hypothetical protein
LGEENLPEVQAALIFTSERSELQADNAPYPTLSLKKLKEFIRKTAKNKPISVDLAEKINQALASPA